MCVPRAGTRPGPEFICKPGLKTWAGQAQLPGHSCRGSDPKVWVTPSGAVAEGTQGTFGAQFGHHGLGAVQGQGLAPPSLWVPSGYSIILPNPIKLFA